MYVFAEALEGVDSGLYTCSRGETTADGYPQGAGAKRWKDQKETMKMFRDLAQRKKARIWRTQICYESESACFDPQSSRS